MTANIYYDPEKFGLKPVGEVQYSYGSYDFDITAVWRRDWDGALVWADDSGCSCPSPFELTGVPDLATGSWSDLKAHLDKRLTDTNYEAELPGVENQIAELMSRVVKESL